MKQDSKLSLNGTIIKIRVITLKINNSDAASFLKLHRYFNFLAVKLLTRITKTPNSTKRAITPIIPRTIP